MSGRLATLAKQPSVETLRVLLVAGIPVGVLVTGVLSRLAMFVLRITSADYVRGVKSDDGFIIGRFTLGGSYNLMLLGASVGVIGAGLYLLVKRWLIGPTWFKRFTTAAASAAVVGSLLLHADGVDFNLLTPTWLAIVLFIALPGVFGWIIGPAVDSVARPDSWTRVRRRRWALPLVLVACFPLVLFTMILVIPVVIIGALLKEIPAAERVRKASAYGFVVRGLWLAIAVVGLLSLIGDIQDITA